MKRFSAICVLLCVLMPAASFGAANTSPDKLFMQLLGATSDERAEIYKQLDQQWEPYFTSIGLDILGVYYLSANGNFRRELVDFLEKHTKQNIGDDVNTWYQWLWQQNITHPQSYTNFKSDFYHLLDHRFKNYFDQTPTSLIRMDEIRWGGVRQDGIPPLRQPEMITASNAHYLGDNNIVFGIVINGDARAYPKRILAWHELFSDTIGGIPIAGVYCTLCGSVIAYESKHKGKQYQLGTSGFLYRSNKLMYDKDTQSLWSTMRGKPVVGPLANKGIQLKRHSVITTTWKDWKIRYPQSKVLSLNTGHKRNYDEGEAYRDYFATDNLMFDVALKDNRLKNKNEVLALRTIDSKHPLAIDIHFLAQNTIFHTILGKTPIVLFTANDGTTRVYESKGYIFNKSTDDTIRDQGGQMWEQTETGLIKKDEKLLRIPSHRAFWFGWYAAFPDTQLIM